MFLVSSNMGASLLPSSLAALIVRTWLLPVRTPVVVDSEAKYSSLASSALIISAMTLFSNQVTFFGPGH